MKKTIIIVAMSFVAMTLGAQNSSDILNAIKNVASSVISVPADLSGNWTYQGVGAAVKSDNVLTAAAGNAAISTVESKMDKALSRIGLKKGSATLTFSQDGSFALKFGKVNLPGTWTQEGTAVTIKFGKVFSYLQLDGTVTATTDGCKVLFNGEKFLEFTKKLAEYASKISSNSTIKSINSLLSTAKSVDVGFKLSR